jgi:glycosyltransferase involved in cell wall biosynthesis
MSLNLTSQSRPSLYILDPGSFTPSYDLNLALALAQRGWQPRFVTAFSYRDEIPVSGTVTAIESFFGFLRSPMFRQLRNFPRLRQTMKCASYPFYLASFSNSLLADNPGIVHVQWALMPVLDLAFWRMWKRNGWSVAYTVHDPLPLTGTLPRMLTWQQSRLQTEADCIIVHSIEGADIIRRTGRRADSVYIIPPGPPTMSSAIPRNQARAALNMPPDLPMILFFGYIKKYKGLQFLLQSLPLVQNTLGSFLCVIAGEFKEPSKRYRRLISKLQLKHELRLVEGYIPEHSMAAYFSACDVVALPYLEASSSGVLLCAYSFGKPVVATSAGGNLELVEDGRSGYLVSPGDSSAMAKALCRVLKDPDLASQMGSYSKKIVKDRYSWEQIAERTERTYLKLGLKRQRQTVLDGVESGASS